MTEDDLELEYKHYTFHDAAPKGLPLKWCECQPVVGKKVVTMEVAHRVQQPHFIDLHVGMPVSVYVLCWCQVQPISGDVVSFLWMGQTWSFRSALDAADIRGACTRL